jgi:XTP/dITP diphosphohydrolase
MIPSRLVLATANRGKVVELRGLVAEWGSIEVQTMADFSGVAYPPEAADSYEWNAVGKARAIAAETSLPALADDSGLEVDVLGGSPGVRSARYADSDADRISRLLAGLSVLPGSSRRARFRCVVALAWPGGRVVTAQGECKGRIATAPAGLAGFGYDPVFISDDLDRTFAEVTPEEKAGCSHRARAMRALGERLRQMEATARRS